MSARKKCPLCNRKLAEVNGVYTCPDCGYRDPQSGASYAAAGSSAAAETSGATSGMAEAAGTGGASGMSGAGSAGAQKPKQAGNGLKGAAAAMVTILAVVVAGVILSFAKRGLAGVLESAADAMEDRRQETSSRQWDPKMQDGAEGEKEPSNDDQKENYRLPESALLIMLAEELFQKPVNQISAEELYSIVYLYLYEYDDTDVTGINVMLEDGREEYYWVTGYDIDTADFACLGGLEYLLLDTGSVSYNTDWHALKRLQFLSCDASLKEIAERMDVSQLFWVHSGDTFGMFDLSVLSKYTSLEHLELEMGLLGSIEGISDAPALKGLYLIGADRVSDFSALYDMPNLEALSIESAGLKDIGFVSGMDQLYFLELKDTKVRRIDAISDCADTLTVLRLEDNYEVEDISSVMECTGLEELQLWVKYQFDVPMEAPDFSAMTNLRRLSLDGYDRFTNLALLPWLEELAIECPGAGDGEPLKQLTNLRSLELLDMSVFQGMIDAAVTLENLTYVSLEDSFIWCDIGPLFELPGLQELNLRDAQFGLRPELLQGEGGLYSLDLTRAKADRLLEDGGWDYGGAETEIPMQEVLDTVAPCLPQLEWLNVPRHDLDSLEFVENLPELVWLDISNNYITDLTPLVGLDRLTVLLCEDNPIRGTDGLENVIICQ